jgi:riboflavin synthase
VFTGLIQSIGKIVRIQKFSKDIRLKILPTPPFKEIIIGESIAVNGACLTVESVEGDLFTVYVSEETLQKTNLKKLTISSIVNLERALTLGDRLGGHLVSGHVDCLSCIKNISTAGMSKKYILEFPEEYSKYVIEKGSIALDGISLTVNCCGKNFLEVNIIPETQKKTTISIWEIGTLVNTEFDIIGKYIEKMVGPWVKNKDKGAGLTIDFLKEHGF